MLDSKIEKAKTETRVLSSKAISILLDKNARMERFITALSSKKIKKVERTMIPSVWTNE